jgi:hypothetical protein
LFIANLFGLRVLCQEKILTFWEDFDLILNYEQYDIQQYVVTLISLNDHVNCGAICELFGGTGTQGSGTFIIDSIDRLFTGNCLVKL